MGIFDSLPNDLASALGISSTNAALLLSLMILVAIGLAIVVAGSGEFNIIATAVPMLAAMGFLVAIGWLPYWILITAAILTAAYGAKMLRDGTVS